MPHSQLSDVAVFYAEKGQGEPLVFLNGLSGDHLYWTGQLRAFGKRYRCLALDNRDAGQTLSPAQPYTTSDLAGDVAAVLERLQLPPAHIVGLSMGGMIAQELALAAPARVKTLALVNTLGRADDWFRGTLRAFEMIRRRVEDSGAFFDAILPWWVSWRFFEQSERVTWLRWLLRQNPHQQPLDGFLRQLEATSRHDALNRVAQIRCPVLVLAGEEDTVCPPRYGMQLKERLPQAQLVVVPGVGHAMPFEDPARFTALLAGFLADHGATDRQCA
ncbi:MAG TPA: alpha/beta hydrolase [Gemmataceae bacterium]|nr:alpha/beta hydrolase [Gemmataceae bacterium]